jgi:hypothetical protein
VCLAIFLARIANRCLVFGLCLYINIKYKIAKRACISFEIPILHSACKYKNADICLTIISADYSLNEVFFPPINPHQQPPYLDFHLHVLAPRFVRSPNPAFTLTSRNRFPLISLPLHSGEAKQRWESFCSVVFYSSSSQQIKLVAV